MSFVRWSSYLWNTMHFMTLQYEMAAQEKYATVESYESIVTIIENLHNLMDCNKCKKKYIEYLQNNSPRHFEGSLFVWTVQLHNIVNESLNREPWDIDKARKHYLQTFL